VVGFSGSRVLLLLVGLLLSGVRALIGIIPGLSTIVAYAGRKFFRLAWTLAADSSGNGNSPKA
jgi:hypothetical protein